MPVNRFTIGDRQIGPGHPVYLVAELSANHNRDYEEAVRLVHAAKRAGADAVKLQTYTPETMTLDSDREWFRIGPGTAWSGKTLYQLYSEAYTPWEWQPKLKHLAEELGMDLFASPFDATAVDFLEEMDTTCYKIASFENVDLPLIRRVAATGKPLIISTGMATGDEIAEAVDCARSAGCRQLALLKCTSAYPAPAEELNLRTIPALAKSFDTVAGLSDHTLGIAAPIAAVTLGAYIIEKHFTLERSIPGPDSSFSLQPEEFAAMAKAVRFTEKALGRVSYGRTAGEEASLVFRRSLFVVEPIRRGERFTSRHIRAIRPGYGLHSRYLEAFIGKIAARDIQPGTPLDWKMIGDDEDRE